jgi:hypothetical protein
MRKPLILAVIVAVLASTVLAAGATAAATEPVAGGFQVIVATETSITLLVTGDIEGQLTYPIGGHSRATTGTFEGTVLGSDPGTIDVLVVFAGSPNDGRVVSLPQTGIGGLEGLTVNVRTALTDPATGSGAYAGIAAFH